MKLLRTQKTLMVISFLNLVAFGCNGQPQRTTTQSDQSVTQKIEGSGVPNAAAKKANAHNFVEIEFTPGSSDLTENAKSSVNSVLEQARQSGKIDEVIVMSWSDSEYPSKDVKKLPKAEKDLAERRNKAVESFIKSGRSLDVDKYNMAAQPNVLSKWFNTRDSRLKNSLVAAGLPTTADNLQYPSKASRSVILVKLE